MATYFTPKTFSFLRALAKNNERAWFNANKARYEQELRAPYQRFIADLAGPLRKISPHFVADPRPVGGSMFRIHRDTRFAKDKTPYKTCDGRERVPQAVRARRRRADTPDFLRLVLARFREVAPMMDWLCGALDLDF
jgi:uncharacterized protein (TIGR02453 family)